MVLKSLLPSRSSRLDARILFHYMATVITPAMVNQMVGAGSQYALLNVDKNGEYMDGSKTYKLNIPADVPAKDFWSIVAYDPQTRSQLQTSQPFPGRNNQRHKLDINEDYFDELDTLDKINQGYHGSKPQRDS